jgi:SAM-dependent methyltransferase
MDYFKLRGIELPSWLSFRLKMLDRKSTILDFGCGFGQNLQRLREFGFADIYGADVNTQALTHCKANGINTFDISAGAEILADAGVKFDLIISTHVLEHIPKNQVIGTVAILRKILNPGGQLIVAVPNAQAFTGAYWAYEDFTHHTLFTSGSLLFVLRAAGFAEPQIIDKRAVEGLAVMPKLVRTIASLLYELKYKFWKKMLASATHVSSVDVYTYEVKASARA